MPDEYRVTIRLSPNLYTQLETRGSRRQPLAAIVREALAHYLARQPDQMASTDDTAATLAAMAASIEEIQGQVQHLTARLDALVAGWQPAAAVGRSRSRKRQPVAAMTADSTTTTPAPVGDAATPPTGADTAPRYDADAAVARMKILREEGLSLAAIAARLTAEGVPARHGAPWHKGTVGYLLQRHGR
jgi:predicted transcriptional regulator